MINYVLTDEQVDYAAVADLMQVVDISSLDAEQVKLSFQNSQVLVFAFEDDQLVGCGRALSDGVLQANIYNIAVAPHLQGQGIGRQIIERLLDQLKGQIVTLYTHPKTSAYYQKLGFSQLRTGFVKFLPEEKDWFIEEGFIDR
ncbi:MAG: GNAT family N-acetyltransferase [Streptococcaceae bacterium]|jgi:N-acetylglutamate synthase-like GNAT family acetyltransferase|nr:GNAT family N-acetyltransferase [Streptococcaceae bacterium]